MPSESPAPDDEAVGTGPRYNKTLIQATLTASLTVQPWRKPLKQRNTEGWAIVAEKVTAAHNVDPPLDQKSVHEKVDAMVVLRKVCYPIHDCSLPTACSFVAGWQKTTPITWQFYG